MLLVIIVSRGCNWFLLLLPHNPCCWARCELAALGGSVQDLHPQIPYCQIVNRFTRTNGMLGTATTIQTQT